MFTSLGRIFNTPMRKAGFSNSAQASAPFFQGERIKWALGCSRTGGFVTRPLLGEAIEIFVNQPLKVAPAIIR